MFDDIAVRALALRTRIESKGARHGLAYPWWIAVSSALGQLGCVLLALLQRDALLPPQALVLTLLLVALPWIAQLTVRWWVPWWLESIAVAAGATWLVFEPLSINGPADAAPGVFGLVVAEVTATDGPRPGLVVGGASVGLMLLADEVNGLPGVGVYALEVLLGFVVGYMLRWQMRALAAERAAKAGEHDRATLAERQRIAREIHDLVAHSLSVTMLHVTGARRALTDGGDVDEAVDALRDAERIGRQAMTDIRHTVSVLATEATGGGPLPTAADIADLVADVSAAGLSVSYTASGDLEALSGPTGLGIYRIAQESLSNVAKHAPTSPASVRFVVEPDQLRLSVRNPLPLRRTTRSGQGSGLDGMTSRAAQLGGVVHAGPVGGDWLVDLVIPVGEDCFVRRRR